MLQLLKIVYSHSLKELEISFGIIMEYLDKGSHLMDKKLGSEFNIKDSTSLIRSQLLVFSQILLLLWFGMTELKYDFKYLIQLEIRREQKFKPTLILQTVSNTPR